MTRPDAAIAAAGVAARAVGATPLRNRTLLIANKIAPASASPPTLAGLASAAMRRSSNETDRWVSCGAKADATSSGVTKPNSSPKRICSRSISTATM